ncbi:MAG: hypothetical protein JWP12_2628 [Bacteroidetes bacterium]|nr:hypothetical protein [Bacteroidota bacterium]
MLCLLKTKFLVQFIINLNVYFSTLLDMTIVDTAHGVSFRAESRNDKTDLLINTDS